MKTQSGFGRKALLAGIVVVAAALLAATFLSTRRPEGDSSSAKVVSPPADFCTTSLGNSQVSPGYKADNSFHVDVPAVNPTDPFSGQIYEVAQGSVVEYTVHSSRPGAVAVHGLLDPCPVTAGGETKVAFRAIYDGQFPLHFHGADASHIELAGLIVTPASAASH
jgi:hypothetical protein